jgi:hypothetical protein
MIEVSYSTPDARDEGTVRAADDVPMQLTKDEARHAASEVFAVLNKWSEHGRERVRAADTDGRSL